MQELTALEIKKKLIADGILKQENKAKILIDFLSIKAEKINKDIVGSMMETWLEKWFVKKNIYFRRDGTQKIPDFYINKKKNEGFLEIKCFCGSASFDIQSWNAFLNSMIVMPEHINADYLIFKYNILGKSFVITDIYVKKIWQMSRPMSSGRAKIDWPVNVQYKNNVIVNLRPKSMNDENNCFINVEEFLNAIQKTIEMYKKADEKFKNGKWLEIVKKIYKANNKKDLF